MTSFIGSKSVGSDSFEDKEPTFNESSYPRSASSWSASICSRTHAETILKIRKCQERIDFGAVWSSSS